MKCLALVTLVVLASPVAGREVVVEVGGGLPSESGYLQTPAGGMPGTASSKRPTLGEIDLDGGHFRWLGARVDFGQSTKSDPGAVPFRLRLHARFATIGDGATSMIDDAFTIRGGVFAVGDSVRSQVSYDRLTLALTGVFGLGRGLLAEIGPEISWTAFDFTMAGERHEIDRAYHVTTFGLVGGVGKKLRNGWHVGARIAAAPAFDGVGSRHAAETWLGRVLTKRLSVAVGARLEEFRYDDGHKQELPNRLKVTRRVLPMVVARLRL